MQLDPARNYYSTSMRFPILVAAFLSILLPCAAQDTLQKLLQSYGIPAKSFSQAELSEKINGAGEFNGGVAYAVFLKVDGETLVGSPQVVRYDQKTGLVLRSTLRLDDKDTCCGSPDGIQIVDDYLVLSFHYNPSASTLLVLDQNLQILEIMYGFGVKRIAPHQIVATEAMMQFAPIHAARLQYLNLVDGASQELYPPMNDDLRANFNKKNETLMPPNDVCFLGKNDYCDPKMYDEGIDVVGADGNGHFALVAGWDSSHSTKKGEDQVTIASESVLYLYAQSKNGWLFCEQELSEEDVNFLASRHGDSYELVKSRCKPDQAVVPDMTTSDLSPFPEPRRYSK